MKKTLQLVTLLSTLTLCSCGGNNSGGNTVISLWGWGDEAEINVFTNLIREYNETNTDNIYVNYVKKPSGSYYSTLETNLTGRQAPDLFYVGDSMIKRYANAGYLEPLNSYVDNSTEIDLDDIWGSLNERFQFNPTTYQYGENENLWGLPKDNGPTVIYYNEDAFKAQGITIISAKDDDGDGKITIDSNEYKAIGYDAEKKVFNNQIAMTIDEFEEISKLFCHDNAIASRHQTKWSFYSSWWFWAGFSVGGDCIQFHKSEDPAYDGGYWEFTLDNDNPNYHVLKDCVINGHNYKKDSFVDYYDLDFMKTYVEKQAMIENGTLVELPSIFEMFNYWINLFHSGISPKPSDISTELSLFTSEEVAMYVTGRYDTVQFRKNCSFNWDCAPLPMVEGGVNGGHSGSMCLSMSKKCANKNSAFKVVEYLCGKKGQNALAETGFNVPSQKCLANDPDGNFLKSDKRPYNNQVFLDAASYQKGGDWTYLKDDVWIEIWSPTLNGDVLNGVKTVDQLFSGYKNRVNDALKEYTKK